MPLLAPMSIACLCLANFLAALESSVLSFMEHTACLTDQTLCVSAHGASNSTLMFSSSCILRKLFYLLPCQVLRTGIFCHVKFCVPVSSNGRHPTTVLFRAFRLTFVPNFLLQFKFHPDVGMAGPI
eukprot:scpid98203/ scgid1414/ 